MACSREGFLPRIRAKPSEESTLLDLAPHFSRFLAQPERLHFAAHSHHPWLDVTRNAQIAAWDDAARLIDGKWEQILGPVLRAAQGHVARQLALPDPATVVFAPNTHELLKRLLSCFPAGRQLRVLTSDAEFHSFTRQIARLEEEELVVIQRIAAEPFESFAERFAKAARAGHHFIYLSSVFFNSGFALEDVGTIAAAAGDAMLVIDGYHAFMARPVDWSALASRAFFIAGGYKYAMAGEGACFMHCPPGWGLRPRDTGWYAGFGALSDSGVGRVSYAVDAGRFMGATFDASGLYRFNAVQDWLKQLGISVADIHRHARELQRAFLAKLPAGPLEARQLVVPEDLPHGNFLTLEVEDAAELQARLLAAKVVTDHRGNRLRIGFGIYQTAADVDALIRRLQVL